MSIATVNATKTGYVDGYAEDTYANVHDRSGDSAANSTSAYVGQECVNNPPAWFYIGRGGFVWDLSPYSGTVSAATLTLTQAENRNNAEGFDLTLLTGDDLADTLVAADYGQLHDRTTSFGAASVPSGATTAGSTYVITINATGLAYIETKMGTTLRLALRSSRDINTLAPGLDTTESMQISVSAELSITYTPSFIPKVIFM